MKSAILFLMFTYYSFSTSVMATEWYRCWFEGRRIQLLVVFEEQQHHGYWWRFNGHQSSGHYQRSHRRNLMGKRTVHEEYEILSVAPAANKLEQLYAGSTYQWLEITQRQVSAQRADDEITAQWYRGHGRGNKILSGQCAVEVSY